jgi:hypothetical protein
MTGITHMGDSLAILVVFGFDGAAFGADTPPGHSQQFALPECGQAEADRASTHEMQLSLRRCSGCGCTNCASCSSHQDGNVKRNRGYAEPRLADHRRLAAGAPRPRERI